MKKISKVMAGFLILAFAISTLSFVPIDANALSEVTIVDSIFDTESDIALDATAIDNILNTAKLYSGSSEDTIAWFGKRAFFIIYCMRYGGPGSREHSACMMEHGLEPMA